MEKLIPFSATCVPKDFLRFSTVIIEGERITNGTNVRITNSCECLKLTVPPKTVKIGLSLPISRLLKNQQRKNKCHASIFHFHDGIFFHRLLPAFFPNHRRLFTR